MPSWLRYKCKKCGNTFDSVEDFVNNSDHIWCPKLDGVLRYCINCKCTFGTMVSFNQHMDECLADSQDRYEHYPHRVPVSHGPPPMVPNYTSTSRSGGGEGIVQGRGQGGGNNSSANTEEFGYDNSGIHPVIGDGKNQPNDGGHKSGHSQSDSGNNRGGRHGQ